MEHRDVGGWRTCAALSEIVAKARAIMFSRRKLISQQQPVVSRIKKLLPGKRGSISVFRNKAGAESDVKVTSRPSD